MADYYGDFAEDDTVLIPFNTFTSDDPQASSTITNLADSDIHVHKDGGLTQIATDGATVVINFDSITGNHMITIDTSAHADYSTGSEYAVRIEGTTVDAGTINAWVGSFSIERAGGVLALIKAGNLSANVVQISGDSTAADNLELQYDTTGLTGDTFPATQSQVSSIVNTGSAINVLPIAAPNGFTLTTGSEVGDEDRTHALDGVRHELSDTAGTLDAVYKFDIGGDAAPVGVTFTGLFNSANDSWDISANIGTDATPVWQQIGTLSGSGGANNTVHTFDMFTNQIVTDLAGIVHIRVNGTGLTTSSFDPDQVFVSKSDTSRSVGYAQGRIWVDTVDGTAGTESYVNGVADKKVDSFSSALTIGSNIGIHEYNMSPDSTLTLAANLNDAIVWGVGYALNFGGYDCGNTHFYHASPVNGVVVAASGHVDILDSIIANVTVDESHFTNCTLTGTITLGSAGGDVRIVNCRSGIAGATTPVLDFGTGSANHDVFFADYQNGIEIKNFNVVTTGGTDLLSMSGVGKLIVASTCDGGTINLRGIWEIIDNSGGAVTFNYDDLHTEIELIHTATVTDIPALIGTPSVDLATDIATVLTTQMTESYAADGVAPTLAQATFLTQQVLTQFAITGTSFRINKLDGTTQAAILTLNDASNPTAADRTA